MYDFTFLLKINSLTGVIGTDQGPYTVSRFCRRR